MAPILFCLSGASCFHGECIFEWLKENDTCPMCRDKILITKALYGWIIDKSEGEKIEKAIIAFSHN